MRGLTRAGLPDPAAQAGPSEPRRRDYVERAKLFSMRLYLAVKELRDGEAGQAMVEYALILALVSVAAVGILAALGTSVSSIFSSINKDL